MLRKAALSLFALVALTALGFLAYSRITGTSPVVHFGGAIWIPVSADYPFLPRTLALALRRPVPSATLGPLSWREIRPGFAVAELPAMVEDSEVDRILLARVDPKRFKFIVRNDPTGSKDLSDWLDASGAMLIINGSYYGRSGLPSTPVVSERASLGPADYQATHGAFISRSGGATITDLTAEDWRSAFRNADNAMVSYPLLLARDGSSRVAPDNNWLANRSFLAEDKQGNIIFGTTKDAFFSLERLAAFLKGSPLDLATALNLDGGPVACQGIRDPNFRRESCGRWEIQVHDGRAKMLPPLWIFGKPPMPIAITVHPL